METLWKDTLEYLEYLDEFVDMYDVSCGLNPSLQYQIDSNFLPDGWRSYMARAVKDKFKKPVINAGNYRDPKIVEKVLESGDVDIVGMGRGLIAEPNWVKKVENGEEDILRKCISCKCWMCRKPYRRKPSDPLYRQPGCTGRRYL